MKQLYIGVDMGSSSTKLIMIDEQGNIIKQCREEYETNQPHECWKEINPEIWYAAVMNGFKVLLNNTDRSLVKSIGITGQMHTTTFLDSKGDVLRPAICWDDTRSYDLITELASVFRTYDDTKILAESLTTGCAASNLYWTKIFEPNIFDRISHLLIGPDYLVYKLTGCFCTDYCNASTSSLFDWSENTWSSNAMDLIGAPLSMLSHIKGASDTTQTIQPHIADSLGLNHDVRVTTATGDNAASAVAAGLFSRKCSMISLGTSGIVMFSRSTPDFNKKGKNILFSLDGQNFKTLVQGSLQTCGSGLRWWCNDICTTCDSDIEYDSNHKINMKRPLIYYPYLSGDKTIYSDALLRGAFLGISSDTSRQSMTNAILEGISFGLKQLIEELEIPEENLNEILVNGGGSSSNSWLQLIANVLNTTVLKKENTSAAYGVALIAAQNNEYTLSTITPHACQNTRVFAPESTGVNYDILYEMYKRVYKAMATIYNY